MQTKRKNFKKYISIILCAIALTTGAFALTPSVISSTTTRYAIAKNWELRERGWKDNNCLGWALGNTTQWVWPWGEKLPSVKEDVFYHTSTSPYYSVESGSYGSLVRSYNW